MRYASKTKYLLPAALLLSSAAFATGIKIDGTCITGGSTCLPPGGATGNLSAGQSASGSGSQALTLGDGDTYSVTWSYSNSFTSGPTGTTNLFVDPVVTYTGVSPSVGADSITFDMIQAFYSNVGSNWNGTYTETIPLMLSGAGAGSSISADLCYSSGAPPVCISPPVTQTGNGSETVVQSQAFSNLTNPTLNSEYQFTFNFEAGTTDGANGSSPASSVPEPAQMLPVGLALLGVACYQVVARRRRSISTN